MDKTLLIMAAGMGSRFGGLKQVRKFGKKGLTLLDYAVLDAKNAGFNKFVFVIRKDIEELFRQNVSGKYENSLDVNYAFQELNALPAPYKPLSQRQKPWGTGHAVLCAKEFIKEPFLAINADDYYGPSSYKLAANFIENDLSDNLCALIAYELKNTLSPTGGVSRGVCCADDNGYLKDIKECYELALRDGKITDKDGNVYDSCTKVSMNFWCFAPSFMDILQKYFLEFLKDNSQELKSEFYLPAAVDKALTEGMLKAKMPVSGEIWQGVTYADDAALVEKFLEKRTDI